MLLMIVGLVVFLGMHSVPIATGLHGTLEARLGARGYRLVFTALSVVGLIAIIWGFGIWKYQQGSAILYVPPVWMAHIALLLMAISFVLLAAAHGKSHIRKRVKHPMLVAVKIWAFAHLLANGAVADVVLFGAFLAWAVADRISVKRRERAGRLTPAAFEPTVKGDVIAVGTGLIVYVLFVWKLHLWLIGVSPLAM